MGRRGREGGSDGARDGRIRKGGWEKGKEGKRGGGDGRIFDGFQSHRNISYHITSDQIRSHHNPLKFLTFLYGFDSAGRPRTEAEGGRLGGLADGWADEQTGGRLGGLADGWADRRGDGRTRTSLKHWTGHLCLPSGSWVPLVFPSKSLQGPTGFP